MTKRLDELFQQQIAGKNSTDEKQELLELMADPLNEAQVNGLLAEHWHVFDFNSADIFDQQQTGALLNRLIAKLPEPAPLAVSVQRKQRGWSYIAAAASVILCLSAGLFYLYQKSTPSIPPAITMTNDIAPGGNKAYLTLAGGKKIILTGTANGNILKQDGILITKTKDGQLVYTAEEHAARNKTDANTITTPNGGKWQVKLPDGTLIWLNAASSITYPVSFTGLKERRVELKGEAYFEVAKDKLHPFVVQTSKQDVEVLGTHFNINAYTDEPLTKTMLLEGSVRVTELATRHIQLLKPGQLAQLSDHTIKVSEADADTELAWKNGDFFFNNEDFESILRKVEKWYDVEFQYKKGSLAHLKIWARVSRSKNISSVLTALEVTGQVKFRIEGRRVIVMQ